MIIQLKNVCKAFDDQTILQGVQLSIRKGERIALIGPSGSGKTTLVRLIAGLEAPDGGEVVVQPSTIISCHFQENRLLPWYTVEKNLRLILPHDVDIPHWLHKAGLDDALHKLPGELSGGMKRRVSLLRALLFPADLLILDEPYRELDQQTAGMMIQLTEETIGDRALILVTHQMEHGDALHCTPVDVSAWSRQQIRGDGQSAAGSHW